LATKQKYFIAIIPPDPLFSKIELIKKQVSESYNNKSALRAPAHITLHLPFEWVEEKENILLEKLQRFKFGDGLSIQLKNYSCFEPKVLFIDVLPNAELNALQGELVQHIKQELHIFNQADDKRAYHPHITIAFRDLKKALFYKAWEEYKNKDFKADFLTNSFFLLKHNGKEWHRLQEFIYKPN
jgi:2'-5' RNA ligase